MSPQSEPIELSFEFSEDFLVEAINRRERATQKMPSFIPQIILPTFVLLPLAILAIVALGETWIAGLLIAIALLCYVAKPLYCLVAKRNHRRSQFHNELVRFRLSHAGVQVNSTTMDARFQWDAYSRAVVFADGVLLFQSLASCNWLAFRYLNNPDQAEDFIRLVKERLGDKVTHK